MTRRAVIAVTVAAFGATASLHIRAQSADPQAGPTYSRDVAPIIYKNCAGCHRPGEIGPMSLLTYANTYPWTKAIAARVSAETMPPWHADPSTGEFLNDRRLDPKDKATLLKWVANGAPEGDAKDLPAPPRFAEGWTIGQPDAVVKMAEDYPIPASGNVAYQYFEVPTNFAEDRWVQAYEVRPGNRTAVHHVIVYTRPPAPATPPAQPGDRPARPRPQPVFTMPDDQTTIPAGQTGGEPLPDDQRKPLGPNDRPAPKMLGPVDWRIRARQRQPRVSARDGDAPGRRLNADLPDALHDQRKADDRSDEHRLRFLENAAGDRAAWNRAHQRRAAHSGWRKGPSR